jgi:hypothetical protein
MKELLKVMLDDKAVAAACEEYARDRSIYRDDHTVDARVTHTNGIATVVFTRKRVRAKPVMRQVAEQIAQQITESK